MVVGDGAMGTRLQAAELAFDGFRGRSRHGQDEIRSAANWLGLVTTTHVDTTREFAVKGAAIAERVESRWASRLRVTT
ncbi:hypothetical protein A5764_22815 [Mycobacterium sp. 852002-51057_SCH5723018]|nr:hypothetical protein A5764_22815 [Mycobacterium sp. 852002-51057_SCH5723018]